MKTASLIALSLIALTAVPVIGAQALPLKNSAPAQNAPHSFADLSEKLLPSVVNISSTQKIDTVDTLQNMPQLPPDSPFNDFFQEFFNQQMPGMPNNSASSLGSGFIIDADKGYIVTNYHVIKDADDIRVTLHDDTSLKASLLGHDEKTDIAVLKVEKKGPLQAVSFGNSDLMRVGDWVLAIGNPFGLGGTVTAGIISARQRDIQSGPYDDYIQTDASINRGNSGGPMFNTNGEVIGINTAIFSPSGGSVGIGFAIPSSLADPIIKQLIEYGKTRRGWLGVRIQNVTDDIADSLGLKNSQGALIASVSSDGPAAKAGLQAGDVILEFDGKAINAMRSLPRAVAETPIDKKAKVVYWRNNKRYEANVTIGELDKAEDSEEKSPIAKTAPQAVGELLSDVGLTVSTITEGARQKYGITPAVKGLLITALSKESNAHEKGVKEGDVIVEINQKPVGSVEEAKTILAQAKKAGRSSALFLINQNGEVRFVALKIK